MDNNLPMGTCLYRLKMVEVDSTYIYSDAISVVIGIPGSFLLSQNYPNPFNPSTRIDYAIPSPARITIRIYAITGQLIKTLVDEDKEAGYYTVHVSLAGLSSGVYVYRATMGGKSIAKKMLYLK